VFTLLIIIQVITAIFLIFIVLIQGGKGAEVGPAFGGSAQTIFGPRGAATFMTKLTVVVAVIFMLTSMSLAVLSAKRVSIMPERSPIQSEQSQPAKQ